MKLSSEKGAAIVEFALIVPLLLLLIFGMIEFGILLYNQHMLTNASREGARRGIVSAGETGARITKAEISEVINAYCENRLITFGENNAPVIKCYLNGEERDAMDDAEFGDTLAVSASFNYDFLLVPALMEGFVEVMGLSAQATMKYE